MIFPISDWLFHLDGGTIPTYCVLQFLPFISIGVNSLCISIDIPCVPMCILSTLPAVNSIENYYYYIEFRMDIMHIGTQAQF